MHKLVEAYRKGYLVKNAAELRNIAHAITTIVFGVTLDGSISSPKQYAALNTILLL